jgi:hypothetical protein
MKDMLIIILSTLLMILFAPLLARRLGVHELLAMTLVYVASRFLLNTLFRTKDAKP